MRITSLVLVGMLAASAHAHTATVQVSHDRSSGVVLPGETIRVNALITWDPSQWAGLKGGVNVTGNAGSATNIGSEIAPGLLAHLGSPAGGSVTGFDVASVPHMFVGWVLPIPFHNYWGVDFLWFDWTAPSVAQPTPIAFDFVADPMAPNVRLYPMPSTSPAFVEADTTYVGTSILVLPAPTGLGAFLAAACLAVRRRR
jgi:hypothetical protein